MQKKPNIVICMCDQLRAFEVGCYGNATVRTPNIDQLAAEGFRFEHAVSNNPLCMPARSALLSGQFSRTCTGVLTNETIEDETGKHLMPELPSLNRRQLIDPTLPEHLREQGYRTALIGKWHIQPSPSLVGFDTCLYPYVHHRHTDQTFVDENGIEQRVDGYSVEFEVEKVKQYLKESAQEDQPFFLYYNISPPHMPLADAPEKYLRMFSPEDVPLRPNVMLDGELAYNEEWFKIYLWDFLYYDQKLPYTQHLPEGFDIRHLTALYYGLIAWVDDTVGHLMDALKANGIDDDTIVVFVSDHGDNLGSHHLFNKGQLIEEAIRIPMIFRAPKLWSAAANREQVAQIIDIMPTLLDLACISKPENVQGRSLKPILVGGRKSLSENYAFIETDSGYIGIRTPTHKYGMLLEADLRTVVDDRYCFYDLQEDPYEWNNLAHTSQQEDTAECLRSMLLEWNRNTQWLDVTSRRRNEFDEID